MSGAAENREASDRYHGAPEAEHEAARCPLDGGLYFESDGTCELCGRTSTWVEERADWNGRYYVFVVLGDGVPFDRAQAATLAHAVDLADAARDGYRARRYSQMFVGVTDYEDPERGSLSADSWREGFDDGPDPNEPEL